MVHCTEREVIMKTKINSSVKRVLSLVIAFALLIGTLFTANVGININADAETSSTTVEKTKIVYWNGNVGSAPTKGSGTETDPYIIETAEQLNWLCIRAKHTDTVNKFYKVDPTIKAFILQPEEVVKEISENKFMNLSSAAETQEFFEEKAKSFKNWITVSYDCMFDGTFDGNGVEIYGLYGNAALAGCDSCGLFNYADGGGTGKGTTDSPETDTTGITIKNFAVRNSYFKSYRRGGIIVGATYGDKWETCVKGYVNINNCEVTNNFFVGQDWDEKNNNVNSKASSYTTSAMAIVVGNCDGSDKARVDNCIIYGNKTEYRNYTSASEYTLNTTYDDFNRTFANNGTTDEFAGSITNSLVLDTKVANVTTVTNVFGNVEGGKQTTLLKEVTQAQGKLPKKWSGFDWAGLGDTEYGKWYAREGAYPTLSCPGDGKFITEDFAPTFSGSSENFENESDKTAGTKENPYIIKTPAQLYKMVQGGTDTKDKYYKVADGVKTLYLSDIEGNESLAYVKANAKTLQQWALNADNKFYGHFDGNGVTITGMVSTDKVGFVGGLYCDASIKNVKFENCYVKGNRAAVITSGGIGVYSGEEPCTAVIANVSVRDCYIEATGKITSKSETNNSYNDNKSIISGISAAGFVAANTTPTMLTIVNCLYDGNDEELVQGDTSSTVDGRAGFVSFAGNEQCFNLVNCVSLGARPYSSGVDSGNELGYYRFNGKWKNYAQYCYTDTKLPEGNVDWNSYPVLSEVEICEDYEKSQYSYLDFLNNWDWEEETNTPIPKMAAYDYFTYGEQATYTDVIKNYKNNLGLKSGNYPTHKGDYGWQEDLTGSGTEADPYIIDTPLKLAIAIATGGQLAGQPLYYKLACDIDLGGMPWIDASITAENQPADQTQYKYTPFSGTLDGDGHTVSGLNTVSDNDYVGLIPYLTESGTVKNLHLRNSFVYAENSGAYVGGIVGAMGFEDGSTNTKISGCSVETTTVTFDGDITNTNSIVDCYGLHSGAVIENSYYIAEDYKGYFSSLKFDGDTYIEPDVKENDILSLLDDNTTWYQSYSVDGENQTESHVRLLNQIKAGKQFDLNGDGEETTNDVTLLINVLVGRDGFDHAYADVNGDGKVDILDLAIARRRFIGSYNNTRDGFWRNVELGKVSIYYDCNDNYDSARKLQLYIESVYPTVSITKYTAGTVVNGTKEGTYTNQDNAVVINKNTSLDYDKYNVTYDYKTNVLKINGGSFTAVEQAVLDLLAQNTHETKSNFATVDGTLSSNKNYRTVFIGDPLDSNDTTTTTYYYAWGDEFGSDTLSRNTWFNKPFKQEGTDLDDKDATEAGNTRFLNLEEPNVANIDDLWAIEDGKLSIKRGVNTDVYTGAAGDYSWGYVGVAAGEAGTTNDYNSNIERDDIYIDAGLISTEKTMLFKQGYAEMKASLPSDGHAFPAWWFMGGTGSKNNNLLTSLYNKVYKENPDFVVGSAADPANYKTTYQYILPTAYLEFDIVELMQVQDGYINKGNVLDYQWCGRDTGNYDIDYMQFTVHKWYSNYVKDGNVYIPNWADGSNQTVASTAFGGEKGSDFIHKYAQYSSSSSSNGYYLPYANSNNAAYRPASNTKTTGKTLTSDCTYGFYWVVKDNTYRLTVFADYNGDGNMTRDEVVFSMNEKVGQETTATTNYTSGKEGEVWDQYMYMILDNAYYTSNSFGSYDKYAKEPKEKETGVTMFTDLLTYDSSKGDKTTFDIDYVRVYQQDGKRDLVTAETEAFNTGSHFGY